MTDSTDMVAYYTKRAPTLEDVYDKPERQADLVQLQERVCDALRDHHVLEIACGTGYWTERIAACAASVLATDVSADILTYAQAKDLPPGKARFAVADAYHLDVQGSFDACFAGFWWSHVKREDQGPFLASLGKVLQKDGLLVMIDNAFVEEGSLPIARTDHEGNTYQIRTLENGERFEVVKNFPTDSTLRKKIGPYARDIRIQRLTHYWMLTCRLK
jgi:ubiquinone/menaquinone biosynthesis C-methylase UbiE